MIAVLLSLLMQAAGPAPPADWSALAPIPYRQAPRVTDTMRQFVAGEIAAGRCAVPKPADGHYVVSLDVAALIGPDGMVRRAVPRAIHCPTVEQYGAGLVSSFARDNMPPHAANGDTWYRATLVFDWTA